MNTYSHPLTTKYLTNDQLALMQRNASKILSDMEYLKAHTARTCDSRFVLIPEQLSHYYGDGKLIWKARNILANQHYWLKDSYSSGDSMYSYTLVGVDCAFKVSSEILFKIFNHEDKDEINKEFVPDFIEWSDYLLDIYSGYLKERDELIDISYSHSPRYCEKLEKFTRELGLQLLKGGK